MGGGEFYYVLECEECVVFFLGEEGVCCFVWVWFFDLCCCYWGDFVGEDFYVGDCELLGVGFGCGCVDVVFEVFECVFVVDCVE